MVRETTKQIPQMQVLKMLAVDRGIQFVSLGFRKIGSVEAPLVISHSKWPALVKAKNLCLTGHEGCNVRLERGARLAWENFSMSSENEVGLDFEGCLDYIAQLKDFNIACGTFTGPACAELAQALARSGRQVYWGNNTKCWWLNSFPGGKIPRDFDMLMLCGCHSCLSCLHRSGKLPEGSPVSHERLKVSDLCASPEAPGIKHS